MLTIQFSYRLYFEGARINLLAPNDIHPLEILSKNTLLISDQSLGHQPNS